MRDPNSNTLEPGAIFATGPQSFCFTQNEWVLLRLRANNPSDGVLIAGTRFYPSLREVVDNIAAENLDGIAAADPAAEGMACLIMDRSIPEHAAHCLVMAHVVCLFGADSVGGDRCVALPTRRYEKRPGRFA